VQVNMPATSDTVQGQDGRWYKFRIGKDGKTEAIAIATSTGEPLAPSSKGPTEGQGRAALFSSRASASDNILRELEDKISVLGLSTKQGAEGVWGIGGMLGSAGNKFLSDNQQKVEQAQRDFVNAVLRQESGAVINPEEFNNARKQYFPQPGDRNAVLQQKRNNRRLAIEGLKKMAGPAGKDIEVPPIVREQTTQDILKEADRILLGR